MESVQQLFNSAFQELLSKYGDQETNPANVTMERLQEIACDPSNKLYFILLDNRIIGSMRIVRQGKKVKIGPIGILPEFQNQGIGQQSMFLIEQELTSVKVWLLDTIKQEEKPVHFYLSLGYKPTGQIESIQPNMDSIFLRKEVE
ncbi:GNAT family N-acetyltransferase [Enterococcus sp. LJL128]